MSFPLAANNSVRTATESILRTARLPHAILIEGDAGTGRHTLAHYLAKAAVCSASGVPCESCKDCHLADVGSHPDISYTGLESGKKNLSVAQIRTLRAEAFVKAHSASHRVFVIDPADKMNEQAQNALLKILEEPPANVIFILITASRTRLLETIVSRCTVLSLSVPDHDSAKAVISGAVKASDEEIDSALIKCGNNIGRALALLEHRESDAAVVAAGEFLRLLFEGNELDMLRVTLPFEKDRAGAEAFYSALRTLTAKAIRESYNSPSKAKTLSAFYDSLDGCEVSLKTNVNLPLLFCATVCRAKTLL